MRHVKESSRHLLALIDDILDISKLEAGHLDLKFESFPLSVAADEVLSTLRPLAAAKDIHLTTDLSRDLMVHADHVRVKQILYNLLSNGHQIYSCERKGSASRKCERRSGSHFRDRYGNRRTPPTNTRRFLRPFIVVSALHRKCPKGLDSVSRSPSSWWNSTEARFGWRANQIKEVNFT